MRGSTSATIPPAVLAVAGLAACLACSLALVHPVSGAGAGAPAPAREVGDLSRVGAVEFPTSCDPAVQADFERGLALLHSFFYDEARRVFTDVAMKDPECAIAHWGIAMTYYHPIWTSPDSSELAAGQAAVERALAAKKASERERAFIRAIEAFYKGLDPLAEEAAVEAEVTAAAAAAPSCHAIDRVDHKGRAACFKREMEKVSARYPEDMEAAAFYALGLLGTSPPLDTTFAQQKQAAAILERWFATHRDHPGLAHYLIHSYDYPPLAERGLPAARLYAEMAPWVPHALHMPSHIFTRLGMWKETIAANLASTEAARRYAAARHPGATSFEELHALDYLAYAYLQTGQHRKAGEVLEHVNQVQKTYPESDFVAGYALGTIPARYALERRQWKEAAALELRPTPSSGKLRFAEGHIVYARAVGAARSGDLEKAAAAVARLGELAAATEPRFRYFADHMETQRQAVLGLVALAKGEANEGLRQLAAAADREDELGKHPVSPGALLPIRELLGEALLEAGKPAEALAEFEASLALYPARFNGLWGAARAAERAGREPEARRYYRELVALAQDGDGGREALVEAQAFLAEN